MTDQLSDKPGLRAGIFQSVGGGLTPGQRLNRLNAALEGTALDLVVCPELFLSGYHAGDAVAALAETPHGPFAGQVADLARAHGTAIVYGYPERAQTYLYNSALCIDAGGNVLANHRKLVLPPGFETDLFISGDRLTLFDLAGVRCAILICYDAEFPEAVRAATEAGAELVIVPTALVESWPTVAHQLMPTRAFENGVWLLYANHAGAEGDARYLGASCILAPDGTDAARAGAEEQLIVAEIDPARVAAARERLPYLQDLAGLRKALRTGGEGQS